MRLFIAIPLPQELRRHLTRVGLRLAAELPRLRLTPEENLHLTLHFLGDQADDLVAKLGQDMLSIGGCTAGFDLRLHGVGAFPRPGRARVLWAGVEANAQLLQLQRRIGHLLRRRGCEIDARPYRPHLTLGRVRGAPEDATAALGELEDEAFGLLRVREIMLYQSLLGPGGAEHRPLSITALQTA